MIFHIAHENEVDPAERFSANAPFMRTIEKKFLEYGIRNANTITAQTGRQAEMLGKYYHRNAKVIPNFHPMPLTKPKKQKPINVLWVANFKDWKRPDVFIRLARQLHYFHDASFIMVGKPSGKNVWQAQLEIDIEGIDNLHYLGELSQDQVKEVMQDAHVFVNSSVKEGSANTFIQVWMRCVTVVSLSVDPDNLLVDKGLGMMRYTEKRLAEVVPDLIVDGVKRDEIGEIGYRYAMQCHTLRSIDDIVPLFSGYESRLVS